MEAMEAREGDGIARPFQDVVADPTPNLTVQLFRQPEGEWIGIRAQARWRPAGGVGAGSGVLLDIHGEVGPGLDVGDSGAVSSPNDGSSCLRAGPRIKLAARLRCRCHLRALVIVAARVRVNVS